MKNKTEKIKVSLLIELLNSFTEKEIEKFAPLVSCTYFNTDQHVSRLFDCIKGKIWRRKTYDAAMQYKVYCEVFSKRPVSGNILSKEEKALLNAKMALLTRLAETFLMLEALKKKPACKSELLQDELLDRKQFLLFNRNIKKDKKQADKRGVQDIDYHNYQYKIEQRVLNHLHQSGQLAVKNNLPALNKHIDVYYMLSKLSLYLTAQSIIGQPNEKPHGFDQIKHVLALTTLPDYTNEPLIQIYRTTIKMMETEGSDDYRELMESLTLHANVLSRNDLTGFYSIGTVFCSRQIVQGKLVYNRKLFELYQAMHRKDLLHENGVMDVGNLKNLVTVSSRVAEFDWATQMIDNYRTYVETSLRNSVCHFNLGAIAFYQNDYKAAISHFIRVDKVNLAYDVNCRIMLLKSHYETDLEYDERTMQIFRSAEKFMHDNKSLPSGHKIGYKNFIRLLINLYRIRHRATKISLARLGEKLEQAEFISDKHWLVEKMKELG